MKKSLSVLWLLWILVLSGCGWSMNVVEYNDNFVSIVKECTDANQTLFENFQSSEATTDSRITSLQENITICENAKEKALKLWYYDKDSSLKDAVVNLLSMEVDYLGKFWSTSRYRDIHDITDEDEAAYEWLANDLHEAEESLNTKFTALQETQEAFAARHRLKLE